MKPITEPITREILERALESQVKTIKSPQKREVYLDRVATKLLVNDERVINCIGAKYLHEEVFHQAHRKY
jgi:hypothetical protein